MRRVVGPGRGRRVARASAGIAGLLLAWATVAAGDGWGGITPGETTRRGVEARHGAPTRERMVTSEGRTAAEWTYADDRAPRGLERMVIEFGLLEGNRFLPDLVRSLTLYPKPRVFSLLAITNGWGAPDAIGTEESTGRPVLRFRARAMLIILDPSGSWAEVIAFAPVRPPGSPRP